MPHVPYGMWGIFMLIFSRRILLEIKLLNLFLGGIYVEQNGAKLIGYKLLPNNKVRLYLFNKVNGKYRISMTIIDQDKIKNYNISGLVPITDQKDLRYFIIRETDNIVDYFDSNAKVGSMPFKKMKAIQMKDPSIIVNDIDCFGRHLKQTLVLGRETIIQITPKNIDGQILVDFDAQDNQPIYSQYKIKVRDDGYLYLDKYIIQSNRIIIPKLVNIVPCEDVFMYLRNTAYSKQIPQVEQLKLVKGNNLMYWNNTNFKSLKVIDFQQANKLVSIGEKQFNHCYNLETVKIKQNELVTIGNEQFSDQTKLQNIDLDCIISNLGFNAFKNTAITQLNLKIYNRLHQRAVCEVNSLRELSIRFYSNESTIEKDQILQNYNLKSLQISQENNDLVKILSNQVADNSQLSEICLPNKIELDSEWLKGCKRVNRIYCEQLAVQCKDGEIQLRLNETDLKNKQLQELNNINTIRLFDNRDINILQIIGAIYKMPRLRSIYVNNRSLDVDTDNNINSDSIEELEIPLNREKLISYIQLKFLQDIKDFNEAIENISITYMGEDSSNRILLKAVINGAINSFIKITYLGKGKIQTEVCE